MRIRLIILALATVLAWDIGYCQDNIYTWRDKNGVLNITDVPPPQGAEILDISPSYRQQAEKYQRQRLQERSKQAVEAGTGRPEAPKKAVQPQEKDQGMSKPDSPKKKRKGY